MKPSTQPSSPKTLPQNIRYILGLDLGIASVGWAAILVDKDENPVGLLDVGVRTFERAEVPKTGESLAAARRQARSVRRLIRRRAHRILRLQRLLKREGVLQAKDFDTEGGLKPAAMTWLSKDDVTILTSRPQKQHANLPIGVWGWRALGLDQKLAPREWAAVLLHLMKHRGYLSQRKNEVTSDDKELGKLLAGVHDNATALKSGAYRSAAELAIKKFAIENGHLRNQGGNYTHTFDRKDLEKELHLLFQQQRKFGNPHASSQLEEQICELLMTQREALQGDAILAMLGHCTFEPEEFKAAKNTYSAERFVWLTKLNNLRINHEGEERGLTPDERAQLINEPYQKAKLTYTQVRKILNIPESAIFKGIRYGRDEASVAKAENATLMEMKAYHAIRRALTSNGLKTEWASLGSNPKLLDLIGQTFSVYKTDQDIHGQLREKLPENVIEVLLANINFDKFIQLSLKALSKILPEMENGKRYDEACTLIYGDHHGHRQSESNKFLPIIPADEIRNPVVIRSLSQARKIINAIIRRYGSPLRVHIETGRDLGKSYQDRQEIKKRQEDNKEERKRAIQEFKKLFPNFIGEPKGGDILKLRLYELQHGKCLYSGKPINLQRLSEKGYVEIDHALPFSRTWDNSFNNKVLVLAGENQNKSNQTPYEWLDGKHDSERWREFVARVHASRFSYGKKQRILTQKIDEEGFKERNLNDTRYVARFLCHFIEDNLYLTGTGKRRVFASNGQITAFMRGSWGLGKVREESDRHHALDAVVVACSTLSIQKKITDFIRQKEMNPFSGEITDKATGEVTRLHFPQPWDFFHQEVMIRIFDDNPRETLEKELSSRPQAIHEYVTPLFVSRAPTRKMSGQGHLETVKSAKYLDQGFSVSKVPLTKLRLKDIENIVGFDENREPKIYEGLRLRLEQHNDDPAKAFTEPFYKYGKNGTKQLVKSLRVKQVQKSGVLVRKDKAGNALGIADNATMVRVDVFGKNGKNYLVPVYAWQFAEGILPNKAVIAYKDESDWEEMTEAFAFRFSLYPNDLVKAMVRKMEVVGYFNGLDRSTGAIHIKEHDLAKSKGKDGIHRGVGVKSILFEKYQVDPLGKTITLCQQETRQPLK